MKSGAALFGSHLKVTELLTETKILIQFKHKALTANNKSNIGFAKMCLERKRQMNTFENALKETMSQEEVLTENGAVGFKSSGHALLDINFATRMKLRSRRCSLKHTKKILFLQ